MIKKIIAILLVITGAIYASANAYAASPTIEKESTHLTELDMYRDLKASTDEELLDRGLSAEEIAEVRDYSLIEAFKERATLSNETLLNLGYTEKDIATIKTIAAQPNITEDDILVADIFAELDFYTETVIPDARTYYYRFAFEWSKCPMITATDVIAVIWCGITSTGAYTAVAIEESLSFMDIDYYDNVNTYTVSNDWYPNNELSSVKCEFPMKLGSTNSSPFAKSGWGRIILKSVGSSNIYEMYFRAAYGHTVVGVSPSVSFSGSGLSISCSFGWTTEEAGLISRRD